MIFELINPHDPYTLEANSLEVAAVTTYILGKGIYCLREITGDGSGTMPVLPTLDAANRWFLKNFDRNLEKSMTAISEQQTEQLVKSLASVTIGDIKHRRAMEELLQRSDTFPTYIEALKEMHDAIRTSDIDIGRVAWGMADVIQDRFGVKTVH